MNERTFDDVYYQVDPVDGEAPYLLDLLRGNWSKYSYGIGPLPDWVCDANDRFMTLTPVADREGGVCGWTLYKETVRLTPYAPENALMA